MRLNYLVDHLINMVYLIINLSGAETCIICNLVSNSLVTVVKNERKQTIFDNVM